MFLCQSIILIGRNGSDNTVTSDARSTIPYQNLTKWPPNNPFLILMFAISLFSQDQHTHTHHIFLYYLPAKLILLGHNLPVVSPVPNIPNLFLPNE